MQAQDGMGRQRLLQGVEVEGRVDGVSRLGVGELKLKQSTRRNRVARAAKADARAGGLSQLRPRISLHDPQAPNSRRIGSPPSDGGASRAWASYIPIRSSQASNSGAGRRPSR